MVATNELLGLGAANVAGAFCGAVPTRPGWNLKRDMVKEVVKDQGSWFQDWFTGETNLAFGP